MSKRRSTAAYQEAHEVRIEDVEDYTQAPENPKDVYEKRARKQASEKEEWDEGWLLASCKEVLRDAKPLAQLLELLHLPPTHHQSQWASIYIEYVYYFTNKFYSKLLPFPLKTNKSHNNNHQHQ